MVSQWYEKTQNTVTFFFFNFLFNTQAFFPNVQEDFPAKSLQHKLFENIMMKFKLKLNNAGRGVTDKFR